MSKFVLRVSDKRGDPELALFEADGGAWKLEAMRLIKEWLDVELDGTNVIVLA